MTNRYIFFTDEEITSSSDGSPIPSDRGSEFFIQIASKKVDIVSRIISNFNIWMKNAETLKVLMQDAFMGTETKRGRSALAEFLNTTTVKRDYFIKWFMFRVTERGIWVERGDKKSKVVVRNWTRRHTGDKA